MAQGKIIYVMGASGVGKTRLIDFARRKLDGKHPVAFAHRYITRPLGKDAENYIALSKGEFELRKARGLFAFEWQAYGFAYGIGIEIKTWLKAGLSVVMDGSRAHFIGERASIADVVPVLVTVGGEELRRRLTRRDREDAQASDDRTASLAPCADRYQPRAGRLFAAAFERVPARGFSGSCQNRAARRRHANFGHAQHRRS